MIKLEKKQGSRKYKYKHSDKYLRKGPKDGLKDITFPIEIVVSERKPNLPHNEEDEFGTQGWHPTSKYPSGYPNDLVLCTIIKNLEYDDYKLTGLLPIDYPIEIHIKENIKYRNLFVITGFETRSRLAFHAKPITLEDVVNSKEYRTSTENFIRKGLSPIEIGEKDLRKISTSFKFSDKSFNYLLNEKVSNLTIAKFYMNNVKEIMKNQGLVSALDLKKELKDKVNDLISCYQSEYRRLKDILPERKRKML